MTSAHHSARYIGLMSGTSLDGLDAVIVNFKETIEVEGYASINIPAKLIHLTKELSLPTDNELNKTAEVAKLWSESAAKLISNLLSKLGLNTEDIIAIGAHGQTVRHEPPSINHSHPFSLQAINAPLLAELCRIDVITDFRNRDIVIGGEGAPLAPGFHKAIFSSIAIPSVLINLGGIANVTFLNDQDTFGFDTGPANILMDGWCERHLNQSFDKDGDWAKKGTPDKRLLKALMSHSFIEKPHPKSTGREEFNLRWLDSVLAAFDLPNVSVQATLLEYTALSISKSIQELNKDIKEVYLCGGGAYNNYLRERLAENLNMPINTTDKIGIAPQQVEAVGFAWLAKQFTNRKTGNLPKVTGSKGKRILGALYPA